MNRTLFLVLLLLLLSAPTGAQLIPRDVIRNCPTVAGWKSPTRVQVVSVPEGLRITWIPAAQGPTTTSGFEITRAGGLNGPYRIIGLVNGSVNEFIDREAVPGEIFYYRLRGVAGRSCTPFSNPVRGMK